MKVVGKSNLETNHGTFKSVLTVIVLAVFSDFHLTKEMVMEKPSAQLVGREFVRQYYTLLNQAPDYLHR